MVRQEAIDVSRALGALSFLTKDFTVRCNSFLAREPRSPLRKARGEVNGNSADVTVVGKAMNV